MHPDYTTKDIALFWSKVDKRGPDECWLWIGTRRKNGYGVFVFTAERKQIPAHRAAYEIMHGILPKHLNACHSCDNPPCVNPAHIWPGTQKQNIQDAAAKGRMRSGDRHPAHLHPERVARGDRSAARKHLEQYRELVKVMQLPEHSPRGDEHWMHRHPERIHTKGTGNHFAKLSESDVRAIRAVYARGDANLHALAAQYGVSWGAIHLIVLRRTWPHLP